MVVLVRRPPLEGGMLVVAQALALLDALRPVLVLASASWQGPPRHRRNLVCLSAPLSELTLGPSCQPASAPLTAHP
jgi:hypothetical protein